MTEIPDRHEDTMELLTLLHAIDEAANSCINGINKIEEGGIRGLKELVISAPEGLMEGYINLRTVITIQQDFLKRYAEENATIIDQLEKLVRKSEGLSDG